MGGKRNVLQRQARGDPFVITDNYNKMIDMTTANGQFHFDPEEMVMMRWDGNGTTVVQRKTDKFEDIYRLQVIIDPADSSKVAVRGGEWVITINGVTQVQLPVSADVAADFTSTTGTLSLSTEITDTNPVLSVSGTYYVYARIFGTVAGDVAAAARMDIKITAKDAAKPIESAFSYQATAIRVLALVTTDSAGDITIDPEWQGGNLKTEADVPDGVDPISRADGPIRSLGSNAYGDRELYGFYANADSGMVPYSTDILANARDINYGWVCKAKELNAGQIDNIIGDAAIANDAAGARAGGTVRYLNWNPYEYSTGTAGTTPRGIFGFSEFKQVGAAQSLDFYDMVDGWMRDPLTTLVHAHIDHDDFTDDSHNKTAGRATYIKDDGNATRNGMSGVIGDSNNVVSISPDTRLLSDAAGNTHVNYLLGLLQDDSTTTLDWINRLLDGADWSVNAGTILKILDTTTSETPASNSAYTLGGFGVENGITVLKGTAPQAGLFAHGAKIAKLGSTAGAGVFENGGLFGILCETSAGYFGNGTEEVDLCPVGAAVLTIGDVKITDAASAYYHDSNPGVSIASRLGGGIDFGSTHEVRFGDLKPDDLILVRR